MGPIASAYDAFARRWNTAESLRTDEKGFRAEANVVLRKVYERMQREDRDFYPASRSKGPCTPDAPRLRALLSPACGPVFTLAYRCVCVGSNYLWCLMGIVDTIGVFLLHFVDWSNPWHPPLLPCPARSFCAAVSAFL